MRMLRGVVLGLLLVAGLVPVPARATSPASVVFPVRASVLAGGNSLQWKMMACLARGDIAGAIVMYEAETGQAAPSWLMELQGAYAVANQQVGRCQQVARTIHTAFSKLGQAPQYVAIRALGNKDYIAFDMASGKSPGITYNGYHAAVMLEERVYDAYTGPLGMKLMDYMSRLHAELGVTWTVVSTP